MITNSVVQEIIKRIDNWNDGDIDPQVIYSLLLSISSVPAGPTESYRDRAFLESLNQIRHAYKMSHDEL